MYLDIFNFRWQIYTLIQKIYIFVILLEQQKVILSHYKNISLHISTLTVYSLSSHTFVFVTDAQIDDHFPSMVHCAGNFCQFKYWSHQITQHESCDRWCVSRQICGRNETCNKNLSLLYASFAWLDVFQVTNFHTYLIQS